MIIVLSVSLDVFTIGELVKEENGYVTFWKNLCFEFRNDVLILFKGYQKYL